MDHIWSLHFPDTSFFDQTVVLNLEFGAQKPSETVGFGEYYISAFSSGEIEINAFLQI